MTRTILLILFFSFFHKAAFSQFSIDLEVKNPKDSIVILVYNYFNDDNLDIKDTMKLVDGKGNLSFNEISFGGLYMLYFPSNKKTLLLKIDPNDQHKISCDFNDLVGSATCTDAAQNSLFEHKRLEYTFAPLYRSYNAARRKGKSFSKEEKHEYFKEKYKAMKTFRDSWLTKIDKNSALAHHYNALNRFDEVITVPNNIAARDTFLDAFDLNNPKLLLSPHLEEIINSYILLFPLQKDSVIVALDSFMQKVDCQAKSYPFIMKYLLKLAENGKIVNTPSIYTHLVENYIEKSNCNFLDENNKQKIIKNKNWMNAVQLNELSHEIALADTLGDTLRLHDFVKQYDYTVLIFYSPLCSHCKKAMPEIDKMLNDLEIKHNTKIGRYTINNGVTNNKIWKDFIHKNNLYNHYGHVLMPSKSKTQLEYAAFTNPLLFVLDNNGNVIVRRIKESILEDYFESELGE